MGVPERVRDYYDSGVKPALSKAKRTLREEKERPLDNDSMEAKGEGRKELEK